MAIISPFPLSLSLSLSPFFISKVRDTLAKVRKLSRQLYAFNIIRRNFYAWKLRKVINDRIYNKKCLPATLVIQKYYRGWKVKVCLTIVGERERERERERVRKEGMSEMGKIYIRDIHVGIDQILSF